MLNRVNIMGRLTRDPELKHTQNGTAVTSFTIACERDFGGEDKVTDFIEIVAWRSTAEFISRYFAKGRMAVVSGRLQTRTWTDSEGSNHKAVEVVADSVYFGDSKRESASGGDYAPSTEVQYGSYSGGYTSLVTISDFAEMEDDDGDIPF